MILAFAPNIINPRISWVLVIIGCILVLVSIVLIIIGFMKTPVKMHVPE